MSHQITKEEFKENLNTEFRVLLDPSNTLSIELFEILEGTSTPRQEQFSLLFRGPLDHPFPQGTRSMEHKKLGAMDLFLVPIAKNPEGMVYEAAFNRLIEQGED